MRLVIFVAVLVLALLITPIFVKSDNLYEFVMDKQAVNVKIHQFSVAMECKEIDAAKLADAFKEALRKRVSVKFNIVEDPKDADLVVSGDVDSFVYSEKDPIDILIPIGLVIDLLTTQNYARMIFNVSVYSPAEDKIVWEKRLKGTVNKSDMPRDESLFLVMERSAKIFVRECFARPRKKRP